MDQAHIQVQGRTGEWTTVMVVQNLAPNIAIALDQTARTHKGCRVRAVDSANRVLDLR